MHFSPAERRQELAITLKSYRENAGLDSTKVSRHLGWDPSKISRIEGGRFKRINLRDVLDMLAMYGITDETDLQNLVQIVRESRTRGWWEEYADLLSDLPNLEAGAVTIQTYELLCVPGLLQTREYAAAMFRGLGITDEGAIARRVTARMTRQEVLARQDPPELHAVIDEAALLKSVGGPDVMREQIYRLIELAALPNVTVQVIPNSIGAHAAMTMPFTVMSFSGERALRIVYVEMAVTPVISYRSEDVESCSTIYDQLVASALSPEDTVAAMHSIAARS
ncbi:helix-turn-helix domain-containing protein [Microtetraspora sp. AC03309]|uniref:helix-turn-helix domain-containing protein n=1 Tax=Microtetraspora sp. AC03309 TaxID=2779376 RepID=UPI001E3ECD01|nr:helix-turn-helix transcriptional regulator [Microtetraspora sp. AC03309]MCC5574435.1 helix-turn-helix domain-containing protein [Microtetraspora sp. AC03309]